MSSFAVALRMARIAVATLALLLAGASARAGNEPPVGAATTQESPGQEPGQARPRLALVLSGGGARGAAHVGVLKVLEELHVKPDMIVGTSMGAIVGGLYAAGYSAAEIYQLFEEVHWKQLFVDRIDRLDRSYRRKQDDAIYLIPLRLRFKGWKPYLPPAILGGQRLELLLRSLSVAATSTDDFDRLSIPFRAVAADLENAQAVVIGKGSLSTALRASMSIAGMFPPVEIDGRLLVDGGAAANLPVGIAQSLGADTVIAVDITTPLGSLEELGSVFQIFGQWTGYITEGNRLADLERLRSQDVLIHPELGDISFMAFERVQEAIKIGEEAARAAIDKLQRFALDDASWAAFLAAHHLRPEEETIVSAVRIKNSSWVDDDIIAAHVEVPVGVPYDAVRVNDEVMRLGGLDYSGTIGADLVPTDGGNELVLDVPTKLYGRNSLQFGASFTNDFQGDNDYTISVRHLLIAANRRGGEWENVAQLGVSSLLRTEFYQPFDPSMKWFASAGAGSRQDNWDVWIDGEVAAQYRVKRQEAHLDFGRVLGRWGELRAGGFYGHERGRVRVGLPIFSAYEEEDAGYRLSFSVDTLDAIAFPLTGTLVKARWFDSNESWGADLDRTRADLTMSHVFRAGRMTFYPTLQGCANFDAPATIGSACRLGGLLRLSGLGQDELLADNSVFGSLMGYFALKEFDLGALTQGMYVGLSLESGNAYFDDDQVTWDSLLFSGSVFVGARTVVGPVYIGFGLTEGGRERIYFLLGQRY